MSKNTKTEVKTHYTHPENAKSPTYVLTATGTRLVYPGETVPLAAPVTVDAEVAAEDQGPSNAELVALQALKVADIELKLPDLTADQLVELLKLEQAAKQPRSTLITKIEEGILFKRSRG